MRERTQNILEAAVESFIKLGKPVSSGLLYDQYHFGIKPAMIRHELEGLTEEGFLEQPYRSSGRIPSDRGYEFFVEKILEKEAERQTPAEERVRVSFRDSDWPNLIHYLSSRLGVFGVLDDLSEEKIYKGGLEKFIENLERESIMNLKKIIRDFEEVDDRLEESRRLINNSINIFIGEKSPFTRSHELSVVAESCNRGKDKIFLLAIGPKRMDYKKAVKTFQGIKNIKNGRRK